MKSRVANYVDAATTAQDPATENTWRGAMARALIKKINDNMRLSIRAARSDYHTAKKAAVAAKRAAMEAKP